MSKSQQVLIIEPASTLRFKGPFNEVVKCDLSLTNPSTRPVIFKVKTTVPKRYCVRPNSGIVHPAETSLISVMLQPIDSASIEQEKSKHKFMVQSMYAPHNDFSPEEVWKTAQPSDLMDTKLKVVFEQPDEEVKPSKNVEEPAHEVTVNQAVEEKNKTEKPRLRIVKRDEEEVSQVAEVDSNLSVHSFQLIEVVLIAIGALLVGLIIGKLL